MCLASVENVAHGRGQGDAVTPTKKFSRRPEINLYHISNTVFFYKPRTLFETVLGSVVTFSKSLVSQGGVKPGATWSIFSLMY